MLICINTGDKSRGREIFREIDEQFFTGMAVIQKNCMHIESILRELTSFQADDMVGFISEIKNLQDISTKEIIGGLVLVYIIPCQTKISYLEFKPVLLKSIVGKVFNIKGSITKYVNQTRTLLSEAGNA